MITAHHLFLKLILKSDGDYFSYYNRENYFKGKLMKLITILLSVVVFYSCGNEEATFDGSCKVDASLTAGAATSEFKMCLSYNNVLENRKDEAKSDCTSKDKSEENVTFTATWSDSTCETVGLTAECKYKNFLGESASSYVYDASMNFILKSSCDSEEDGEFIEHVASASFEGAITGASGEIIIQCTEYKGLNSIEKDIFEENTVTNDLLSWEEDGSCTQENLKATCSIESETSYNTVEYIYSLTDTDEATCVERKGVWAAI